jgi:hypothetical protein
MTTFGCRRADLLARCPDQLDCLKQLFGWRNLVRLPSETIQRNPDRPEVHHTAERFKAVPGEPVVTEKLPYDLKVVGPGEVNGPPVPIQEPFEHLSRQIALEDIGALENSRIRMLGRSSWIEFRIVHAGSAGGLLSGSPKLQALFGVFKPCGFARPHQRRERQKPRTRRTWHRSHPSWPHCIAAC